MKDGDAFVIAAAIVAVAAAICLHGMLTRTDNIIRVEVKSLPGNVSFCRP